MAVEGSWQAAPVHSVLLQSRKLSPWLWFFWLHLRNLPRALGAQRMNELTLWGVSTKKMTLELDLEGKAVRQIGK